MAFAFARKRLEHSEVREILCVHCPKSLKASNVREYKNLMEENHCLWNNISIVNPLQQINQKMTKGNRRCISIPVNQLWTKTHRTPSVVTCITSRGDLKRTMWVVCNTTSLPSLLCWKRLCLIPQFYSFPNVPQWWQCQQRLLNCNFFHKSRQYLTSTLYRCFLMNQ